MGKTTSYFTATLCSLALHALLVTVVVSNWQPAEQQRKTIKPKYVQARLVTLEERAKPKPVEKPKPKPVKKPAPKPEPVAKPEPKPAPKPKPRPSQNVAVKSRPEAKKPPPEPRPEEIDQAELEQAFASALMEEEEYLAAKTDEQEAMSYIGYIQDKVASHWNRPPSARRGMVVQLRIQMGSKGRVVGVSIAESSGNEAFDRSAVLAVQKAGQFDRLAEVDARIYDEYFRNLLFKFDPQDLRQ